MVTGALAMLPSGAAAATFAFTLSPVGTGLSGNIGLSAATTGSLRGDHEPSTNATGTRTKPGLFGSFGSEENVPVPVDLTPAARGPLESVPAGGFQLLLNEEAGTVVLSGLNVDLLPAGPVVVPSEISLEFGSFRTRSPDSLFIGGFPLDIPLGENRLTSLAAAQIGSATGTLSAVGVDLWDFNISAVLLVSGAFDGVLGATSLPPIPVPYTLSGRISVAGEEALVTGSSSFEFSNTSELEIDLPAIPIGLPTILPPGGTANVVLELALSSLTTEFEASLVLSAPGRAVPEPGSTLVVCGLVLLTLRRRAA